MERGSCDCTGSTKKPGGDLATVGLGDQGYDDLPPGRFGAAAQQPQSSFKQPPNISEQRDPEKIQGYALA